MFECERVYVGRPIVIYKFINAAIMRSLDGILWSIYEQNRRIYSSAYYHFSMNDITTMLQDIIDSNYTHDFRKNRREVVKKSCMRQNEFYAEKFFSFTRIYTRMFTNPLSPFDNKEIH